METFYAVANGRTVGIFSSWADCNNSVKGYKNAIYKKFTSKEDAELFIREKTNTTAEKEGSCDTDFVPDYYVYTDGACSNNGRKNASSGIGIFFGIDDKRNVSKKIEEKGKHTNNIAELSAIIHTYPIIEDDILHGKKIAIVTDSKYAIQCVSSYGKKCTDQGWNVDIPNKELVKQAYDLYKDKPSIRFIYIKAHTNNTDVHSFGNYNADKLATTAAAANSN